MPKSKRRRKRRIVTTVSIEVPKQFSNRVPSFVRAKEPDSFSPRRTRRIKLIGARRTVKKRVRVLLPRRAMREGSLMYRPGSMTIYNDRRTKRVLVNENNRNRYSEIKRRRRRRGVGQAASLRGDRFNIVGSAVARGRSPRTVEAAAMVARAIERR